MSYQRGSLDEKVLGKVHWMM